MVAYFKAGMPMLVSIDARPANDPNCAVLRFAFGDKPTAPPPPAPPPLASSSVSGETALNGTVGGADQASSAGSAGSRGSTSSDAYMATEAQAPWRILTANTRFCELVGFSEAHLVGATMDLLNGPATDIATLTSLRRACALRHQMAVQLVAYDAERKPFLLKLHMSPVERPLGEAGSTAVGTALFWAQRSELPPASEGTASLKPTVLTGTVPMAAIGVVGGLPACNAPRLTPTPPCSAPVVSSASAADAAGYAAGSSPLAPSDAVGGSHTGNARAGEVLSALGMMAHAIAAAMNTQRAEAVGDDCAAMPPPPLPPARASAATARATVPGTSSSAATTDDPSAGTTAAHASGACGACDSGGGHAVPTTPAHPHGFDGTHNASATDSSRGEIPAEEQPAADSPPIDDAADVQQLPPSSRPAEAAVGPGRVSPPDSKAAEEGAEGQGKAGGECGGTRVRGAASGSASGSSATAETMSCSCSSQSGSTASSNGGSHNSGSSHDSGSNDSGSNDASSHNAGSSHDSGSNDSGSNDAGSNDAGSNHDADSNDAGSNDGDSADGAVEGWEARGDASYRTNKRARAMPSLAEGAATNQHQKVRPAAGDATLAAAASNVVSTDRAQLPAPPVATDTKQHAPRTLSAHDSLHRSSSQVHTVAAAAEAAQSPGACEGLCVPSAGGGDGLGAFAEPSADGHRSFDGCVAMIVAASEASARQEAECRGEWHQGYRAEGKPAIPPGLAPWRVASGLSQGDSEDLAYEGWTPGGACDSFNDGLPCDQHDAIELMSELDHLEENLASLRAMQAQRFSRDSRLLDEMMRSVQARLLARVHESATSVHTRHGGTPNGSNVPLGPSSSQPLSSGLRA